MDLSTGPQMESPTLMRACNAERYSQALGTHPSVPLCIARGTVNNTEYLRLGEEPSLSLKFSTLHPERQTLSLVV